MADLEHYKIGTKVTPLIVLYDLYWDLYNLDYVKKIEFEMGSQLGYINCEVCAEGIQGYVIAHKIIKLYKTYGITDYRLTSIHYI